MKKKVLVVDDCELNCKLILKILNNVGINCDIAIDGKKAVDAIKLNNYNLVLMDCEMPEMDGYNAVKTIRKMQGQLQHTPAAAPSCQTTDPTNQSTKDAIACSTGPVWYGAPPWGEGDGEDSGTARTWRMTRSATLLSCTKTSLRVALRCALCRSSANVVHLQRSLIPTSWMLVAELGADSGCALYAEQLEDEKV